MKQWFTKRKGAQAFLVLIWLGTVAFHIYIWHSTRSWGVGFDSKVYTLAWNVHTFSTALVVMYVSVILLKKAPAFLIRFLVLIGNLSFGIYLIHPLILKYYREWIDVGGNLTMYHLFIAGSFIAALSISALIVYPALYKWKWGWVLFGASPKKK